MNRNMIRHGFILIFIALVFGLFIPAMALPRLGLSAHTIGIMSGVLLIAIGAVWPQFSLSTRQAQVMHGAWLYSSYVNWLGCLLGAILGAGKMTPLASAGAVGHPAAEGLVAVLLISVAVVSFIAAGLSLWGLRSKAPQAAESGN
jgi:hydroxylaminobenzene mutase